MIVDNNAKSLEESVYFKLEEEILNGTLKKGATLAEVALAERLGVSRTPIRGAIHRLAEEGLVSVSPNRGAKVVGVSEDDLVDIYRIRMRLEGLASRLASERISEEDEKRLSESVELSEFYLMKNDTEHLRELDSHFHHVIYDASGNRQLSKILTELHRNIKAYRKLSLTVSQRIRESVEEHRKILDAILAHDGELADRLTSEHVEKALNNLINVVKEKETECV